MLLLLIISRWVEFNFFQNRSENILGKSKGRQCSLLTGFIKFTFLVVFMNCANHRHVHDAYGHGITVISHGLHEAHFVIRFVQGRKLVKSAIYM